MRYIEKTIKEAYSKITSGVFTTKSAFMGLCADIDRYFLLSFQIKMNEKVDEDKFAKVCEIFPNLSGLTCEQFNRVLILYSNIRAVNAHLFKNNKIFFDEDLENYFKSIAEPKYLISINNQLTLYGAFYLLSFLSCKYQIWTFVSAFFRKSSFEETEKANYVQIQQDIEKFHQSLCGTGKIIANCDEDNKLSLSYLNSVCKTSLTIIFFELEKVFYKQNTPSFNPPSFRDILRSSNELDDKIIDKICRLRNGWLHGAFLNDTFVYKNNRYNFSLNLIFNTISLLKEKIQCDPKCEIIIVKINELGQSLFNFYLLRLIEISYKILDNRLLTAEKLEERIINASNAFTRFYKEDIELYKNISKLMGPVVNYKITGAKFQDNISRHIKTEQLIIYHLHSNNGFQIGKLHTDANDLYLANLDISPEFQNKINEKYLSEYEFKTKIEYSQHIVYLEY